jgi:hypothetical protein
MTARPLTQQECLRHAVDLLCATHYRVDAMLLLAEHLDELAHEQRLSPIHAPLSDGSAALAARLRAAASYWPHPEPARHAPPPRPSATILSMARAARERRSPADGPDAA